jgi:hypothetical protein
MHLFAVNKYYLNLILTWDIIVYFLWKEFEYCCGK